MPATKVPNYDLACRARDILKNLADSTRLQVLYIIKDGPVGVNHICKILGDTNGQQMSQPALSHHLALMRASGIVRTQRQGKTVPYMLSETGRTMLEAAEVVVAKVAIGGGGAASGTMSIRQR